MGLKQLTMGERRLSSEPRWVVMQFKKNCLRISLVLWAPFSWNCLFHTLSSIAAFRRPAFKRTGIVLNQSQNVMGSIAQYALCLAIASIHPFLLITSMTLTINYAISSRHVSDAYARNDDNGSPNDHFYLFICKSCATIVHCMTRALLFGATLHADPSRICGAMTKCTYSWARYPEPACYSRFYANGADDVIAIMCLSGK